MQVERIAYIMGPARQECSALLQQCYQQLYILLGAVESDASETPQVTPGQTRLIAAALKGGLCIKQPDIHHARCMLCQHAVTVLHKE